ncbi:AAA family ATPase [Rhizobium skierniewicense]|uniref:AAA family ATPase n=1 Tax=Rhizobium skierniewicense TaxID=984260 RepID=UPI001FAD9C7A|nr:ATP-binding protein [Rhizobium skierniewicense]MCI9868649.1 AAA family ATPase [Rhizobium skierniewicense]
MYAKSIKIYEFKCFEKAEAVFRYPGESSTVERDNINLVLGDNGGGKSSLLKAIAIATLAPALLEGGFVPYRLVRRFSTGRPVDEALLKMIGVLNAEENREALPPSKRRRVPEGQREFLARLRSRERGNDSLSLERTSETPISDLIHDDFSPSFFVVGYGATRRVESEGYSESSSRKRRARRYQRVASLFEDQVTLRPMQSWLLRLSDSRRAECVQLINSALPDNIRFSGQLDEDEFVFDFDGVSTPYPALSDGYRFFIGWIGDLVGQMNEVSPDRPLVELNGIVLVDEIDLHLHPSWQRDVVGRLSSTFPALQFIFTSHSPLIAASVRSDNVIVTGTAENGTAILERMDESLYGRGIESVLLSPYFGLDSARPATERAISQSLASAAAESPDGGVNEAEEFLRRLAQPMEKLQATRSKNRTNEA